MPDPVRPDQPLHVETGKPGRWEESTCEIEIEKLSRDELVLIEEMPKRLFFPEDPIRKVKNYYERP